MTEAEKHRRRLFQDLIPDDAWGHLQAARKEARQGVESLLPKGFVTHRRAARREILLAARSLIDAAIDRLESHSQPDSD